MSKFFKLIFSRMALFTILLLLQLGIVIVAVVNLSTYGDIIFTSLQVLSITCVIYICTMRDNDAYKLGWVTAILIVPVLGGLLFLFFGNTRFSKKIKRRIKDALIIANTFKPANYELEAAIAQINPTAARQSHYIRNITNDPVWQNTKTEYLSSGEIKFERMLDRIRGAERFILLEYFIIEAGLMWDTILKVLVEKAAMGVEVRLLYDDVGCLKTLPSNYYKKLNEMGIKTVVFNPFIPLLNSNMNYRDHRKIIIVDGNAAITGGINLADEYINHIVKHGHWKDASILVEGDAVWNLTVMFLQQWHHQTGEQLDYLSYKPTKSYESDGYVQPFEDTPLDDQNPWEGIYVQLISTATKYVYINTPYLILDGELLTALSHAAQGGVDVRIVTPHIADKKFVHIVTRSYYEQLIDAGVRIYEYTPGFIHAKTFVCDDVLGTVGTTNMDFRSLYLHFECGVWLFHSKTLLVIKDDFLKTLSTCEQITKEWCRNFPWYKRPLQAILKLFAPLM